jgi:Tol biopolymer transport system component
MNVDGSEQRRLTRTAGFGGSPAWSPDGQKIAFTRYRQSILDVYVVNARRHPGSGG